MGSNREGGFVRYQLPAILWALLIFVSSSIPGRVFPHINFPNIDKIVHFAYYFIFAILVAIALRHQTRFRDLSKSSLMMSFLLATTYGVTDEAHQLFVAGRTSDPHDLVADMAGALMAVVVLGIVRWKANSQPEA